MQNYADENIVSSLGFSFCTRSENEKLFFLLPFEMKINSFKFFAICYVFGARKS